MKDLNWINLKFRGFNWSKVKLEVWNKFQSNLGSNLHFSLRFKFKSTSSNHSQEACSYQIGGEWDSLPFSGWFSSCWWEICCYWVCPVWVSCRIGWRFSVPFSLGRGTLFASQKVENFTQLDVVATLHGW